MFIRIQLAPPTAKTRLLTFTLSVLLCAIPSVSQAGWERLWIDSFSGTGVDFENNWTAQTQANYNNEVQCYSADDSSANKNYDVSNGTLKIIARKQSINCPGLPETRSWSSGRLNSKDKQEFLYGRIEARIRFSTLLGGTWPAFWMLEGRINEQPIAGDGDNVPWNGPGAGEIDVWEWFSNQPNSYITNFFNTSGCGSLGIHSYPGGAADVLDWHTYAIEWSADEISFFRDQTRVASYNVTNCAQYKEPMFVLLNVAIGGNLGGAIDPALTTATMEVDYVAHCRPTDLNNATMCNEQTPMVNGDDDGDGVSNADDLCPNSLPGDNVDADGCAPEANEAPVVTLVVTQGGQTGNSIDPAGGTVLITTTITDANANDSHSLNWETSGLDFAAASAGAIAIQPAGLTPGNYTVTVSATDDGEPPLSGSATVGFVIEGAPEPVAPDPTPAPDPVNNATSNGGGSLGATILIILGITTLLRRRVLCQ